mgnify:CR=1 FL=1
MPLYYYSRKLLDECEALLDDERNQVLLAARLRLLQADGSPGILLPHLIGGLWDTRLGDWVRPTPAWAYEAAPEFTVQEQQLALLTLPDEVILVALFSGRQAGKTSVAMLALLIDALRWPGMKSAFISLDYKASREPEDAFTALLRPEWGVEQVKADRVWKFPNGHEVIFRSEEAIHSIRGPTLKTVVTDEAAFMSASSYHAARGTGFASKHFRLILPTTPTRECEWIREVDATWGLPENRATHRILRLETMKNPLRNERLLEIAIKDMPDDLRAAELEGRMVPPADAVYGGVFLRDLHVRPLGQLPSEARFELEDEPVDVTAEVTKREFALEPSFQECGAEYVAGWDFQKEAVAIGKIFRDTWTGRVGRDRVTLVQERIWWVGEEVNLNTTTDHHAQHVKDRWGTSIAIVHDAMGQHDGAGGRGENTAAATILAEHGFAAVTPVARANPRVGHRVRTFQRALRSASRSPRWPTGEVRAFFAKRANGLPAASMLVDAMENQRNVHGAPEKDGKLEHIADAAGYLVCYLLPIEDALPRGWSRPFAEQAGRRR